MSEERLSEAKERWLNDIKSIMDKDFFATIDYEDFEYVEFLIKRVEELKKTCGCKEDLTQTWFNHYRIESMKNNRYHELLEFYADEDNYIEYEDRKLGTKIDIIEDGGQMARNAINIDY